MKALFYLPVVTPCWFDNMVEPLIRRMAEVAQVHVLAPEPWCNTGIGQREIDRLHDLPGIHWSIISGEDHQSFRTRPLDPEPVVDHVRTLAPDYVFCRSADAETVAAFPGMVRFMMEARFAPFDLPRWVALQPRLFDQGLLPSLAAHDWMRLSRMFGPAWQRLDERMGDRAAMRDTVLEEAGIDPETRMLLLPLEYEHEENFFRMHSVGARPNSRLVAEVAAQLPAGVTLAVTNHPLNRLHVDNRDLIEICERLPGVVLVDGDVAGQSATMALAPHAAAMVLDNSKCWVVAALLGVPLLRRSRFANGAWLNVTHDFGSLFAAMEHGILLRPDRAAARHWLSFHFANDAFDPVDPALTGADLASRMEKPVDRARWDAGLERLRAAEPELF